MCGAWRIRRSAAPCARVCRFRRRPPWLRRCCRAPRTPWRPDSAHLFLGLFALLAELDDIAVLEQYLLQRGVPFGLLAQQEGQVHAEVLELFLLRIGHDRAGRLVFLDREALLIPVYGLGLFRERGDHAREGACLLRQLIGRLMVLI